MPLFYKTNGELMANIEIRGVEELIAKLGRAAALDTLRPPMQRGVLLLQAGMANYPPARAGSRYVRTGTLGRRWTTKISQDAQGLTGKVGNNTSYGPFVQSSMFQAAVHRGTWQTDEDGMTREKPTLVDDSDQAIAGVLR